MAESAFNKKFRKHLYVVANIKTVRVESHGTSPGIPDNHYICCDTGKTGWVEMKEADKFTNRCIRYRPHQVPWLLDYAKAGGRCWTACYVVETEQLLIIHGRHSRENVDLEITPYFLFDMKVPQVWSQIAGLLRTDGNFRGQPRKELDLSSVEASTAGPGMAGRQKT